MPDDDLPATAVKFEDLKLRAKEAPLALTNKKTYSGCSHNDMRLDERLALVECGQCGERLDPMNVLVRLAHEESRLESRRAGLDAKLAEFEKKSKTKCRHCGKFTELR